MTPEDLEKHGPLAARAGEILAKSIILWKTPKCGNATELGFQL